MSVLNQDTSRRLTAALACHAATAVSGLKPLPHSLMDAMIRYRLAPSVAAADSAWDAVVSGIQAYALDGHEPAIAPAAPTDEQILEAALEAGLWPNTVHRWLPAFHRYHAILAASTGTQHGEQQP